MGLDQLAQHLLACGEITREELDEARRTQGFFGGQMGSHLLKLGYVDEETLGRALTEVTGVPYATRDHLVFLPMEVLGVIPPKVLEEQAACPFEVSEGRLRVAMLDPGNRGALRRLRASTHLDIEPWVTCEYRLFQALERHYRITPQGRRAISLAPSPIRSERGGARKKHPPESVPEPAAELEVGLDGRPLDAELSDQEVYYQASASIPAAPIAGPDHGSVPAASAPSDEVGPLEILNERLANARDRDDVADALLEFCRIRASRAALFVVGKNGLRGLAGTGPGLETQRLRALTLPVEPSSIFGAALENRDFYFGVVPSVPANREVYSALGGKLPVMVTIVPIEVKGRVASLLYIDDEDRPMSQPDIPLLRRVAAKAGLAFELLLLRNKLREI